MSRSGESLIGSAAFELEALQSERVRIVSVLAVLVATTSFLAVRGLWFDHRLGLGVVVGATFLLVPAITYELAMLALVRKSLLRGSAPAQLIWTLNVIVESLIPTFGLVVLTEAAEIGPYRALAAPLILVYFFFITLSTLRLSPGLARLTGLASAVGYTLVLLYTLWRFPDAPEGALPLGRGLFLTYAAFLLVGGWIAGEVARQIRRHVHAALDEALKNERTHRDLELARSIQQGLLPREPPRIPGFDVAGWNRPADQTGGDFFYWETLPDGRTAVLMADVTGHGIGPALIASLSRAYARACVGVEEEPGRTLTRIDDLLSDDLPEGKLVNLVWAVAGHDASDIELISAGQAPLLVYRAGSRDVESYRAHGVPLGVGLGLGYGPAQRITLDPGDQLILVTDGFFEWENDEGEAYGIERLGESIRCSGDRTAEETISRLYEDVLKFADGAVQADDLTAVIIKRLADGQARRNIS